jgi:hypothetical protein
VRAADLVQLEQRPLGGESILGARKAEIMPGQVHQIRRIITIMDREGGIEPDLIRVLAQQPCTDTVKRA